MYQLLHYRGDLTKAAKPGMLLGYDAVYMPYEVLDAEYDPELNQTTVHLQSASADALRAAMNQEA